MGLLDDVMRQDAAVFTDLDGFGESVRYRANRDATPVTFAAVVSRKQPSKIDGSAATGAVFLDTQVFIPSTAVSGIPDEGAGEICFPDNLGGAARWRAITAIVSEDAGGWTVRCQ